MIDVKVRIEDNEVVVRYPVDSFQEALEHMASQGDLEDGRKVTDPAALANAVVKTLREEREDGESFAFGLLEQALLELENGEDPHGIEDEDE